MINKLLFGFWLIITFVMITFYLFTNYNYPAQIILGLLLNAWLIWMIFDKYYKQYQTWEISEASIEKEEEITRKSLAYSWVITFFVVCMIFWSSFYDIMTFTDIQNISIILLSMLVSLNGFIIYFKRNQ